MAGKKKTTSDTGLVESEKKTTRKRTTKKTVETIDITDKAPKSENKPLEVINTPTVQSVHYSLPMAGSELIVTPKSKEHNRFITFASRLLFKRKNPREVVKLVAGRNLSREQLVLVRVAMQRGLTNDQLKEIIENNLAPDVMQEIIEIAVLENSF